MKAQSAIELVILVGVMLFIFVSFLLIFQNNLAQKTIENKNQQALEIVTTIKNEIDIAAATSDGYSRTFQVPEKFYQQDYNITVQDKIIYFQSSDEKISSRSLMRNVTGEIQGGSNTIRKISLSLPTQNVTGQIKKGSNIIRKVNGEILLN